MRFTKEEEAVSPVIGVILMVAITVILAAVIAVFVFGLAGDLESSAQKDVKITTGTNSAGNVTYVVFSGKDVGNIVTLKWSNGTNTYSAASPAIGDSNDTKMIKAGEAVTFTAIFTDGSSQVVAKS